MVFNRGIGLPSCAQNEQIKIWAHPFGSPSAGYPDVVLKSWAAYLESKIYRGKSANATKGNEG